MAIDPELAIKPSTLVVGICLDCGGESETGVKRFLTKTGHCGTCGSGQTMMPNAVREMKRQLHVRAMAQVHQKKEHRRGKARRP